MKKKLMCLLLAFAMVLPSVPAKAESATQKINYALGAEATASNVEAGTNWTADLTVDGIVNRDAEKAEQSRWSTDQGTEARVLTVNLGEEKTFDEFKIVWEREENNVKGFDILVSSDGENYTAVYEADSDDYFPTVTSVTLDEAVTGQYVQLNVDNFDGGSMNWASVSLYEFEILGTVSMENLALTATATANGHEDPVFAAEKANDGVTNREETTNANQSRWASTVGVDEKWLALDFGEVKTIASVVIEWERCNATDYKIQASADGSEWTDVKAFTSKQADFRQVINFDAAVEAQHIRLLISDFVANDVIMNGTSVDWATVSVYEFEAYGTAFEVTEPTEPEAPETIAEVIAALKVPEIADGDTKWALPEVPAGFSIELMGADYEQIVDDELNIYQPLTDTSIEVYYVVTKGEESKETSAYTVAVPGKYTEEEGDNAKPVVIPELAEWKGAAGEFAATKDSRILVSPDYEEELKFTAETFAADYEALTGDTLEVIFSDDAKTGDFYFTLGKDDAGLDEEGYIMTIGDYVTVEAEEATGAFWAVQSILQILKQTEGTMPKGETRDYPKYEVRGFMLDVGRKTFELDFLYDVVKMMAYYKMSDFQVHLNDNYIWLEDYTSAGEDPMTAYSGFRLESDIKEGGNGGLNKADLTSTDVFYTKDEFRTFIQTARAMGVDIVPEFDTPAHSLSFTKVRPDLKLGNSGRQNDHFNITTDEAYDASLTFIKDLWDEYLDGEDPVFDEDTIINVGTDEYEGYNERFRQMTDDLLAYAQGKGRTVRHWGSISAKSGSTPVRSEGVQMNIWNTYWANPSNMYKQGFDLINMVDGTLYIVPGANYYHDYLDAQYLYNSWTPNNFGGTKLPSASDQVLGSAYAIWNDYIDKKANGLSEYDIYDRFEAALPAMASKLWGDGEDLTYAELTEAADVIGTAPNANPRSEVESKTGDVLDYSFDKESLKDSTLNRYNGTEGENTAYADGKEGKALQLKGGSSYVNTPVESIGPNAEISFWVKADADAEGEQILFDDGHTQVKMAQAETGKVGFSREGYDYSFNYELPKDEWVYLTFKTAINTTELYVNGELEDTLGAGATGGKFATLVFPLAMVGSEENAFAGLIDGLTVETVVVVDDSATRIPTDGFVVTSDNENPLAGSEGPVSLAFDGNTGTFWHSNYTPYTALPATVEIDMGQAYVIDQFDYLPRQSGSNGHITSYELYGKLNAEDEYELLSEGTWEGNSDIKKVSLEPLEVRYLKFVAVEGTGTSSQTFAAAAEFYVHAYDSKKELKAAYDAAGVFTDEDAELFTADSWAAFADAKDAALAVIEDDAATDEEIAAAAEALLAAMEGLTEKGTEPDPDPTPTPAENPFEDVTEADYFYDAVLWAVENKITTGRTADTFAPYATCSRADIVTFLYRAVGEKPSATTCDFTDVDAGEYYYEAMLWAVENGITTGMTETTFAPYATCTRADFVTLFWRAMGKEVVKAEESFDDVSEADYFCDAVLWAVENGVTRGLDEKTFGSYSPCYRGDGVTFIQRALVK